MPPGPIATAGRVDPTPRCRDLLTLAAFELAAGFTGTAREHLVNAAHCSATGCCGSPQLCRAAAAVTEIEHAVLRLPEKRRRAARDGGGATVVPLQPPGTLSRADRAGNRLSRRSLPPERIAASARLQRLLDYWRELWLTSAGRLGDFDAVRLAQVGALGWVHLVDVADRDPARFAIAIRGWRVPNAEIGKSRQGMQLGEHPVRILASTVMADYAAARDAATPLYHCVQSHLRGHRYAYRRLILPLSADGKRTDRLLVATDFG
jgi:hypothetical protein